MNKTILYIRTLLVLMMLLAGATANEVWAATKNVTYHVITLPFSNASTNNIAYRIEAIKKTVTQDETDEIQIPAELKSPLMKYESYSYYTDVTRSGPTKIFPNNRSTFYTYDFEGKTPLAAGATVGTNTDIYVTYVWDDDHDYLKEDYGLTLDLTGNKHYNIEFSTNDGKWFYALNMNQERGNRGQAIPSGYLNGLADLSSDSPVTIKRNVQNRNVFYFKWKLTNNDPYNIILQTAYDRDDFIYKEDGYWKNNKDAQFYGSLSGANAIRTNWVTNEINQAYKGKSSIDSETLPGWYRGVDPQAYGRGSRDNGVLNHLYFSFTLLAHPIASYTLAASWVNVNGDDWVPNSSGQYLLMQHTPEGLPYAGPKFLDLTAADQIRFHEIRDYIYKVEAPVTGTTLTANFEWSDYGKDSLLVNYVPEALKRKYTSITGTYADKALAIERATFQDLYDHEDPDIKEIRDIWLRYDVSASLPFEVGTSSTAFADLKWYNIYVNKEERYITWYDTSGDPAQFSTSDGTAGHTKYAHESHFAFIGDPYELKVVNRQAGEADSANPVIQYLKQGASTEKQLCSGDDDTYYYKPVPKGTALTVGNTYYTSDSGDGETIYNGQVSNGANYYEKKLHYSAVANGTTLTRGITYYTSDSGGGAFIAGGTEVATGSNYYEAKGRYVAVDNGTTLTIGKTYYTSDTGGGAFASKGTEVANGTNYYEYIEGDYVAVASGTRLTIGRTYYTSSSGAGRFVAEYEKAAENEYWEKIPKSDWEIIYDNNTGNYAGCFRLRQFNTYSQPVTIGWDASGKRPLNGDGSGSSTMARLSVLELPMMTYTYYIVDTSGRIAVMATEEQITGTTLNYAAIPEVIRSPFLQGGTLTFKTYASKSIYDAGIAADYNFNSDSNSYFTTITSTNSLEGSANEYLNHIFVSYSALPALAVTPLTNDDAESNSFNVLLNNEYIYYEDGTIKSKANFLGDGDNSGLAKNLWVLGGGDPYAMTIRNREANNYVHVEDWATGTFTWVGQVGDLPAIPKDATRFIVKSSTSDGMYEVMATTSVAADASGKIDPANSVDASTTYYNIGRTDATTVKMYSNADYPHGYAVIRFQLRKSTAKLVTYHLIDIAKKELLTEVVRHAEDEKPQIPAAIFSPLVGYDNYTYWKEAATDGSGIVTCSDAYGSDEVFGSTPPDDVYITYVANGLVDMNHTTMYLLKFEQGDQFRQEDGSDGMLADPSTFTGTDAEKKAVYQAVYPYCNGDGNFFVYGQKQYELQQEGAASTRTRWAWYIESGNHDPYHVKILSRQTETYDGLERSAYFSTRTFDDYDNGQTVVTALVWPNISGVQATEYMVLGSVGQYQLVTTPIDRNSDGDYKDDGEDPRYVVNSFEQYWKTYDTVKKKLLSDLLPLCEERERTDRTDGSLEVPTTPASLRERLTGTGEGQYGFHSYQKMANAKRWNGYNASGEKKKGWETREHWFQTVKMGSGYFDLVKTEISPALILLDQHGWEIMRKPLPYSDQDPDKLAKEDVLRTWDSPMVKEYIFWASAKKRSGLHQYYLMGKRIGGSDFSSTSLGDLPPWGSENVVDNKGNQYDQYVTYIVKEEYAQSYDPSTKEGAEFLISQGDDIAKKGETGNKLAVGPNPGSTSQYIIDNIGSLSNELWYVKPNADIDTEMGYGTIAHDWGTTNPNAYDSDSPYATLQAAQIITASDDVEKYGCFSFSNGFDPYNIQISSKNDAQYFTLGMKRAYVEEGMMKGDYTNGGSQAVTLAAKATTTVEGDGYDNSKWAMTNQTFMAVRDLDGNMQLMPRFDHNLRMRDFTTLVTPTAEAGDANKLKETYTYLYRPFVYNYRIIDNDGHESLRYQSGGDLLPQTPDHFKSPLAKDFTYYKNLTLSTDTYTEIPAGTDISSKEITASLAGAGLITPSVTDGNIVYVRYAYDEDADAQHVLLGKWLTMKLNGKNAVYSSGDGIREVETKPDPLTKAWQWKFLRNPYLSPDPYAVQLFNRDQKDKPLGSTKLDGSVAALTDASPYQRYALLPHTSGGYALAVAGTESIDAYYFLQGIGTDGNAIGTANSATIRTETGFKGATCSFAATNSQILLTDDVTDEYTYHVYTNGHVLAISDTQSQYEAQDNMYAPKLPDAIKTPLLNDDQFIYYESEGDMGNSAKELTNLYGLYDGEVYVRYVAYDPSVSEYKVPNDRNTPGTTVAKGDKSNDAPLRLDNTLPYNIIWYNDNMMKANGSSISYDANMPLQHDDAYEWTFAGDDPYAIKIRHKNTTPDTYVHESATNTVLSEDATTFMLLSRDGYEYGVLAVTGEKSKMLTWYGEQLTTSDTNPTKFIIFSLGTLKVVYHLVIAEIGGQEEIPYRYRNTGETTDPNYHTDAEGRWNSTDGYYTDPWSSAAPIDTIWIHGTTMRDLTSGTPAGSTYSLGDAGGVSYPQWDGTIATTYYCKDVGPVSLGDALEVPSEFFRPNVNYFFVVRDIRDNESTPNVALNTKYKGLQIDSKQMSMNEELIGKIIYIDILYSFNQDLESNSGDNFVLSVDQNKWYTLETVIGGKTYLAQYTNAWGFELKEGRGSHYTNDFLWTPVGDPYGFQLFNRYMDVNSGDDNLGEKDKVIFSRHFANDVNPDLDGGGSDIHTGGQQILMGNYKEDGKLVVVGKAGGPIASYPSTTVATNSIYELLESNTLGYFRFHPVANNSGTQYYFNPEWADDNGDGTQEYLIRLKTTAAEFTFGLSAELMKPYFDRAGYVGGLTKEAYNASGNAALVAAMKSDSPVLTAQQLMAAQDLVYNSENIVQFKTGYYRLHSPLGISGIDPARYASGYTHAIERDLNGDDNEDDAIPMHFYEKNSSEVRQFTDFKDGGFTSSKATRGDITIPPVEKDPASIFYFQKTEDYPATVTTDADKARYNLGYVSTQGLYVRGTIAKGTEEAAGVRAKAVMSSNALSASAQSPEASRPTPLFVMDVGGGVLLIHDNETANGRSVLKYLSYDYSYDTEGNTTIYDLKLTNHTHTDHAKWCMQPVQDTETQGINEMGLKIDLKQDKGTGYYYASFYAPFDVLLTDATNDVAYICKVWDTELIHLKKVGKYNTGIYADNNQFVPAGTPVIIRSNKSTATLALPTKAPTSSLGENIFSGVYLEQLLPQGSTTFFDIYTFGLPMTAKTTTPDYSTGVITFDQQQKAESDMGFYINATPNRESAADMGSWIRNNRYVYGNKAYYRVPGGGSVKPYQTRSADFIPVVFDDDEDDDDSDPGVARQGDRRVYDLQGRLVWTPSSATDYPSHLKPGIYVIGGRKVAVR